jgi:hypothetical protein
MKEKKPKSTKHERIVQDYQKEKSAHLERLATKMLNNQEKLDKLKGKEVRGGFLDLF